MNFQQIIDQFYPEDNALKRLLIQHSQSVAQRALQIASYHPELQLDRNFLQEASMLHDIGIFRCDAAGIYCYGDQPYICHGIIGAQLLRELGYEKHARVCERHTGAGITRNEIIQQQLPLPHQDFLPETLEEQVICYADKFFSKSHPNEEKTPEQAMRSLAKFGEDSVQRFSEMMHKFG